MDSKLRRLAIAASLAVIFLVSAVVIMINNREAGSKKPAASAQTENTTDKLATGAETLGLENVQEIPAPGPVGMRQVGDNLHAFLEDETFFDQEVNPVLEAAKDQQNRLSLIVTSVEKDLRIQIVDLNGEPVTGQSFFVAVEGLGEYKDLDQDGVIYIGDIDAGEYFVELKPIEGYKAPVSETKVRVKEKVEYLAINDISLLIKTEEEIDAEAEDTGIRDALEDADKTELKKLQASVGNAAVGIDVSKWNKEIDWDKVKNAGVEFAIIRAGYRGSSTGSLVEDPFFAQNIKGAQAAGIKVGLYFFTQAVNTVEAVEEASMVIALTKDYHLDYPVFIDTESAGGDGRADGLDVETRTQVCEAFCTTIENEGYRAGVYGSRNWFNSRLTTARLEKYCIWLAEYRNAPLYQGYYQMWQHTSKGRIDGIQGNVDMNISYMGL